MTGDNKREPLMAGDSGCIDLLRNARCADFDGHTEFERLTPLQKLQWLSDCARFIMQVRNLGHRTGRRSPALPADPPRS